MRWSTLIAMKDHPHVLRRSMVHFFSGTLISRGGGFLREMLMAILFGTAPAVAAFWFAFRCSQLFRRVLGEGALHLAFVPHFEKLRHEHEEAARSFFSVLYRTLTQWVIVLIVCGELLCMWLQPYLPPSLQEGMRLTRILLPTLLPIVLYALNSSFHFCQQSFFLPSLAPLCMNGVWIAALCCMQGWLPERAMETLAWTLHGAFFLQWAVTWPAAYRFGRWTGAQHETHQLRKLLRPFILVVVGVTATQINSALDGVFGQLAHPEGTAYLWYALRLQQLPLGLFGVAAVNALLPPLSRAFQRGEQDQVDQLLQQALDYLAFWMIPATAALGLMGKPLVACLYHHGAFSAQAVEATASCLQAYGLGLWPMTLVLVLATPFYARHQYRLPTVFALSSIAGNIIWNWSCVIGFHQGTTCLALGTSLASWVNALLLARVLRISLFSVYTWKVILATLGASGVTWALATYLAVSGWTQLCMEGATFVVTGLCLLRIQGVLWQGARTIVTAPSPKGKHF